MRGYRFRPVWPGIALFALVMLRKIVWELLLSGDILHQPSATPGLETAMAVCQWLFVAVFGNISFVLAELIILLFH